MTEADFIDQLEKIVIEFEQTGIYIGHARRFFDVGEWDLCIEEILHSDLSTDSELRARCLALSQTHVDVIQYRLNNLTYTLDPHDSKIVIAVSDETKTELWRYACTSVITKLSTVRSLHPMRHFLQKFLAVYLADGVLIALNPRTGELEASSNGRTR